MPLPPPNASPALLVDWLASGAPTQRCAAAAALRALAAGEAGAKAAAAAGAAPALARALARGHDNRCPLSDGAAAAAAEAAACVAAADAGAAAALAAAGGAAALLAYVGGAAGPKAAGRALLAVRVLAAGDAGRAALLAAGAPRALASVLVAAAAAAEGDVDENAGAGGGLFRAGGGLAPGEAAEAAAAALANLAGGGPAHRDAIVKVGEREGGCARGWRGPHTQKRPDPPAPRPQAGCFPPLVRLLRGGAGDLAAELAAVALRNAALRCGGARRALRAARGLKPLLRVLAAGGSALLATPMACRAWFEGDGDASPGAPGAVVFDADAGAARFARAPRRSALLCARAPPPPPDPRSPAGVAYPLLDRLTVTECGPDALDVVVLGGGAAPAESGGARARGGAPSPPRRLARLLIEPCAATEVKGAVMRMLTRLHVEREFRVGRKGGGGA